MGSEMCIRDRNGLGIAVFLAFVGDLLAEFVFLRKHIPGDMDDVLGMACLLYTSDAADERSSVDLGGRRIIKKKKKKKIGDSTLYRKVKSYIHHRPKK